MHFLYCVTISLFVHLLLLALPLSLETNQVQEQTEVYLLSGEGSREEQAQTTQGVKQHTVPARETTEHREKKKVVTSRRQEQVKPVLKKEMVTASLHGSATEPVPRVETSADVSPRETDDWEETSAPLEQVPQKKHEALPQIPQPSAEETLHLAESTGKYYLETAFGNADAPQFLHRELPEYPWIAMNRGEEGTVELMLYIDTRGNLLNVEVIKATNESFADAAMAAMKKSTFIPAKKDGKPIASKAIMPVSFNLRNN